MMLLKRNILRVLWTKSLRSRSYGLMCEYDYTPDWWNKWQNRNLEKKIKLLNKLQEINERKSTKVYALVGWTSISNILLDIMR